MLAVRWHGKSDVRVEEVDQPECGRGEIKMKPAFVGICGSDLHEYQSGPVLVPQEGHPITGDSPPVTMGHEFSGTIEEIGEGVAGFSVGQRTVIRPTIFDKTCKACQQGQEHCCRNIGFIGLSGYGGGMAEHIVAPADHYYALPENISLDEAALIEPLAVAWHAIDRSPLQSGTDVMVMGAGPIGIGLIQILKLRGAGKIIAVELLENRKKLAQDYGATHVLDPRHDDIPKVVRSVTDDQGAEIIYDSAGVEIALDSIIDSCRIHGTIVNISVWESKPKVAVNELMYKEINYMGATLYDEKSFQQVIDALNDGRLEPRGMISTNIKLGDAVNQGFKALLNSRDQYCKILVESQKR